MKKTAFCFHNIMQKNRLWGWKLQLSKSDWDKSQRLKVFGRLYFDIQFIFIYLFGWWWCDWDF